MYNRYVGNTGKYTRVEEPNDRRQAYQRSAPIIDEKPQYQETAAYSRPTAKSFLPQGIADGLKGILKGILPEKLDLGDILLILILLLLYIEKEDDEALIILAALVFLGFD